VNSTRRWFETIPPPPTRSVNDGHRTVCPSSSDRPATFFRSTKDRKDYIVFSGKWEMGRIHEIRGGPEHLRWFWSLRGILGKPLDMRTDGRAPTLEAAKAEFEASWRQWLAWAKLAEAK
jgi:hypothetical protein